SANALEGPTIATPPTTNSARVNRFRRKVSHCRAQNAATTSVVSVETSTKTSTRTDVSVVSGAVPSATAPTAINPIPRILNPFQLEPRSSRLPNNGCRPIITPPCARHFRVSFGYRDGRMRTCASRTIVEKKRVAVYSESRILGRVDYANGFDPQPS